jgi:hypothetical protein
MGGKERTVPAESLRMGYSLARESMCPYALPVSVFVRISVNVSALD